MQEGCFSGCQLRLAPASTIPQRRQPGKGKQFDTLQVGERQILGNSFQTIIGLMDSIFLHNDRRPSNAIYKGYTFSTSQESSVSLMKLKFVRIPNLSFFVNCSSPKFSDQLFGEESQKLKISHCIGNTLLVQEVNKFTTFAACYKLHPNCFPGKRLREERD